MKVGMSAIVLALLLAAPGSAGGLDRAAVEAVIEAWSEGSRTKNSEVAAQGYSADADWINAFGMRERGRDAIAARLKEVFGLPFVMGAQSRVAEQEVRFIAPTVAVVITQVEREGQKTPSGEQLGAWRTSHQRVLVKEQAKGGSRHGFGSPLSASVSPNLEKTSC